MTHKGINPLFISALDILLNTLGVFIILNFLNTRLAGVPPVLVNPSAKEQKAEPKKQLAEAKPGAWWRKPTQVQNGRSQTGRPVEPYVQSPKPVQPPVNARPDNPPPATTGNQPSAPQDPVAVDLMKQTKGAVTILLQQTDQAKASVEFMLRQGNRTWKPGRASKFQDSGFQYEKSLGYFYQSDIQPGTYEVLVRVKRGQKSAGRKAFSMYGKIIPAGQKTQTYSFGSFAVDGDAGDWVSAGSFTIQPSNLKYQSRLPAASKTDTTPETTTPTATKPASEPAKKSAGGKTGKWG